MKKYEEAKERTLAKLEEEKDKYLLVDKEINYLNTLQNIMKSLKRLMK